MKKQLVLAATLGAISLSASANYTQLSLGLGANTSKLANVSLNTSPNTFTLTNTGGSNTDFTPSLIDTFHLTFSKHWDWQIGAQYIFAPRSTRAINYQNAGISVYDYDKIKIESNILLINTGLGFHLAKKLNMGLFGGLGTSHNNIGYKLRTASTPGGATTNVKFNTRNIWAFAWDLGANLDYQLSNRWGLGLRYQFIHGGSTDTSTYSGGGSTIQVKSKINRQVYLATLSYYFSRTGNSA